jgi:polyisoprenoid-binding protein YceI
MQTTPAVTATTPQPGHYDIDPSRSRVTFATRHLFGLGRVQGSFVVLGGTAARGLAARYLDLTVEVQCTRS